jgi:hypothetical protein
VTFSGKESAFCSLEGFTITNGKADFGGGINANGCLAMIKNCVINENISIHQGGGIYECNGIIQNNMITVNSSGGGLRWCFGTIQNNMIWMNSATTGGGLYGCDMGNLLNNTIWNNKATVSGGGLYGCKSSIKNCIIWGNSAPVGGAQLYNSSTPSYSCIEDWSSGGTGNITSDPKLLLPEYGEFHLKEDSPCIDAGGLISGLDEDFEGDARGYNGTFESRGDGSDYDIGEDEYR